MLLLPNLLTGREPSRILILEDTIEAPVTSLVTDALTSALSRNEKVVFIPVDSTEMRWKTAMSELKVEKDKVDSVVWLEGRRGEPKAGLEAIVGSVRRLIEEDAAVRLLVILESLHLFNMRTEVSDVVKLLDKVSKLMKDRGRIIAQHHADIPFLIKNDARLSLDPEELIRTVATSYVSLSRASTERFAAAKEMTANVEHKKASGKIVKETVAIQAKGLKVVRIRAPQVAQEEQQPSSNPQPESSFNLSMTTEQRAARDKVVLPYIKAQSDDWRIEYAGDSDEEDPDDDLDI